MRADHGLVPSENIFGEADRQIPPHWSSVQYDEVLDDTIGLINSLLTANEVGLPRAYVEQRIGNRVYRDVYSSYPYVVNAPCEFEMVKKAFEALVNDVKTEIERWVSLGFHRDTLVLVWRLPEKIKVEQAWCRRCGGSLLIRTRWFIRPDREMIVTGHPGKEDPSYVGELSSEE